MYPASRFLLGLIVPTLSMATSPMAGDAECRLVDSIIRPAASSAGTKKAALEMLERIATGRTQDIAAESESQLGLRPSDPRMRALGGVDVRVCAARSLGKTGLPEAVDFLRNLKQTEIPDDGSGRAWSAVQIALREASLVNLADTPSRERFLEDVIQDRATPGIVVRWAMEELCDNGALGALPRIRSILTRLYVGQEERGEEEVAYCSARMQIVASSSDRSKALGAVFSSITRLESTPEGRRLLTGR